MKLAPRDLYRLRRARLEAEAKALLAQLEQNRAQKLALELEYRYRLLGCDATIDARSGAIQVRGLSTPVGEGDRTSEPQPGHNG